ncbi:aminoglycoside phosphotransferase family protein [Actinopolymorpha sp. B11F2]|uniref:phosphotransferase family protein n=1 Tax=Actinopolymorpha sp. B11F2 TaxID=3160862 RepID=UPI0032E4A3ED
MTELRPVAAPVPLTGAEVADAVSRCLRTTVDGVTTLAGYVGNQDFMVRTPAGDYVLKAGDATSINAEAWACETVRAAGVSAPEVVALEVDRATLPEPFLLMRRLSGAGVGEGHGALVEAVRQLRVLHALHADGFGFLHDAAGDSPTPRGPYATWAEFTNEPFDCLDELVAHKVLTPALAGRLRVGLDGHRDTVAYDGQAVLLHGDLHPRHVFADGDEFTGIIDWGDVAAGDPVFDLSRFSRADPASLTFLLDGYGLDLDSDLAVRLAVYRMIWTTIVLRDELRAGGDWFAVHREAIDADLDRLGVPTA